MKKTLLALAVLGTFAGVASAQSSVTIYGVVDLGIQRTNGGTALQPGAIQGAAGRAWHERASTPSRLGFRGNEDLGGGLSAQFQIEHRFSADEGVATPGASFWSGRSYVQLTSRTLGSVYLGREYTPAFWITAKTDPAGQVGVAQAGPYIQYAGYLPLDTAGNLAGTPAGGAVRWSNSLGYKSPSFAGLSVNVAGATSENTGIGRQYGANVEYLQGPIYAGVGFEKRTRQSVATPPGALSTGNNNSLMNVGAAYDFGFVRPMAYYARSKTGLNGNFRNSVWLVGATAPLVGGIAKVMYYRFDPSDAAGALNANNNDHKKLGLGYDYPLSKRTNLYADFGWSKQDGRVGGVPAGAPFTNNKAGAFGVKHTF